MSLAADTREAVRERPTLYDALRAGVVNYTAAAERSLSTATARRSRLPSGGSPSRWTLLTRPTAR